MSNIMDYLDWRGDLSFHIVPFGTVDALLLAQLSYLPFDHTVPEHFACSVSIAEVQQQFDSLAYQTSAVSVTFDQDLILLQKLAESARFRDIRLTGYSSVMPEYADDVQFSAVTCILPDQRLFVAFRGTDTSFAGWKEDFSMSFQSGTAGQGYAADYVSAVCMCLDGEVMLGGHSKGGNFAVYAGAFCESEIQHRITAIYDFDGPGFRDDIANTSDYQAVIPTIISIIPQSSLVGQLLTGNVTHRIVMSKAKGVAQHITYAWEVLGKEFVYADELSRLGVFINKTLNGWLSGMNDENRETVTEAIFDVIQASAADSFRQLNAHKLKSLAAILKALRRLEPEQQSALKQAIAALAAQSREVLFPDTQKRLETKAQSAKKEKRAGRKPAPVQ